MFGKVFSGDANLSIAWAISIVAYILLCVQQVLSSKARWIERLFGAQALIRAHSLIGVLGIGLLAVYRVIAPSSAIGQLGTVGTIGFAGLLSIGLLSALFLSKNFLHRFRFFASLREAFDRGPGYSSIKAIHNLNVAFLFLVALDLALTAEALAPGMLSLAIIAIYLVTLPFWLFLRFIHPAFVMMKPFKVSRVIREAPRVITIRLAPESEERLFYSPGQFAWLSVRQEGITRSSHPYSFSSSPDESFVSFTVKATGDYGLALESLKEGSEALVDGPYGRFSCLDYDNDKRHVMIAGGIGVVPFISMLNWMASRDQDREAFLLWGARTHEDLIAKEDFKSFGKTLPRFEMLPVLSHDPLWQGEKGRIDLEKLSRVLPARLAQDRKGNIDWNSCRYWVCGPGSFNADISRALRRLGVRRSKIKAQSFNL